MHKLLFHPSFSAVSFCIGTVAVLSVVYIGLIATVMSYAALTVEFSQSVKNNESTVAVLEGRYLKAVERIATTDYLAEGYALPVAKTFVRAQSTTALR
ncbi:MAG: hypothetical protein Q7R58_00380 [bacterium]|nr:hypothetical protein [bacterium]